MTLLFSSPHAVPKSNRGLVRATCKVTKLGSCNKHPAYVQWWESDGIPTIVTRRSQVRFLMEVLCHYFYQTTCGMCYWPNNIFLRSTVVPQSLGNRFNAIWHEGTNTTHFERIILLVLTNVLSWSIYCLKVMWQCASAWGKVSLVCKWHHGSHVSGHEQT